MEKTIRVKILGLINEYPKRQWTHKQISQAIGHPVPSVRRSCLMILSDAAKGFYCSQSLPYMMSKTRW